MHMNKVQYFCTVVFIGLRNDAAQKLALHTSNRVLNFCKSNRNFHPFIRILLETDEISWSF